MAELKKDGVVLSKDFGQVSEQGFGERKGKVLVLAPFEALYLVERKKIEVGKGRMGFEDLLREFRKKNKRIDELYAIFKDLRVAGYIARDGKCKTPCFRVYARGVRPEEEPARYLLWVLEKKGKHSIAELQGMVMRAHAVRKKAVFAFVEGPTITYFKIDTTKF